MKRQITVGILSLMAVACFAGGANVSEAEAAKVKAPYTKGVYVAKGKSVRLLTDKKVTYQSKNKKVATVSKKGVVKGKKVGKTKLVLTEKKNKKKKKTITVRVMKNAVKKVKISKKSATTQVGATFQLKATVSAKKKASKKVYWKSSKSSVATVSQKGVVKGKKAGTAKITVQAIDGSKKKATCTVKVVSGTTAQTNSSIRLAGMKVRNMYSLTFSLNRPCALNLSAIVVKRKTLANGAYRSEVRLDAVTTSDNKNYQLTFLGRNGLREGEYVQLQIKGVSNVLEGQYKDTVHAYAGEYIYSGTVGQGMYEEIESHDTKGCATYTLTGLPAGLSYEVKSSGTIEIEGTPTKAGLQIATLKVKDEVGNTFTKTLKFCIGSSETIAAAAAKSYAMVETNSNVSVSKWITVVGGSGQYTFAFLSAPEELTLDTEDGAVYAHVLKPGTYTAQVQVADASNPAINTKVTVTFSITKGVVIRGKVKDAEGKTITDTNGIDISIENKDKANPYYYYEPGIASDGSYATVVPAGTYNIHAKTYYADGSYFVYDYVASKDSQILNLKLPVYRVELSLNNGSVVDNRISWGEDGYLIGYGDVYYLRAGKHTMSTTWIGFMNRLTSAQTTFTITNKGKKVVADVQVAEGGNNTTTPSLAAPGTIEVQGNTSSYGFFSFTPTETATYRIYSGATSGDTYGVIYDSEGKLLQAGDNGGSNNYYQFAMKHELTAGKTYYIGAACIEWTMKTIPVTVEKVAE